MWAHAEYVKLLQSMSDGRVFDLIPEVAKRYIGDRKECQLFEIWKPDRHVRNVKRGYTLRVQIPSAFRLHWTCDEWTTITDTASTPTTFGIAFADIPISAGQTAPIRFTFFWSDGNLWDGHDYEVAIEK